MALAFVAGPAPGARAQAPGLLWTTNLGARVFALDAQTNLYANAGGTLFVLSADGVVMQTNAVCPLNGPARRDAAGNYYFGGSFDGTQDFGGITLVGGWVNRDDGIWYPGWPTCFLAKYAANGSLQWVTSFGQYAGRNYLMSVAPDPSGGCYAGYHSPGNGARVAHLSDPGAVDWTWTQPVNPFEPVYGIKVGGTTPSNCCALTIFGSPPPRASLWRLDRSANGTFLGQGALQVRTLAATNAEPVIDNSAYAFLVGQCYWPETCTAQYLRKCAPGGNVWDVEVTTNADFTLAREPQGGLYVGGGNGLLARYSDTGDLIWSTNFPSPCVAMVTDNSGNRFVSFADGAVARLGAEVMLPVVITDPPQAQTVFVGSNVVLSVSASGSAPLRYLWRLNGNPLSGATSSTLSLTNIEPAQGGPYSVIVSNAINSVISSPALVRVKRVQLYLGDQMLTNGTYVFASPPTLTIRSAFPNGSRFYTLDGSTPSFASTFYSAPFLLTDSATVRAIGYRADFQESEEADPITAVVLAQHTLTAVTEGGGSVTLDPPGGVYANTNIVRVTAVPAPGWTFRDWRGDASGANPVIFIPMNTDKTVQAVFGTTLSTTVAGNGQVQLYPPGGVYSYGALVRLTAVPQPGNYFGFWGNAVTGNTNPLYFAVTSPTQTVSSIFASTPAGQSALTLLINGSGRVNAEPRANVYPTSQSVMLTATPDAGRRFESWSGDASGTQNPLIVPMTQSRVITANFSGGATLRVSQSGLEGLVPAGFRFTILSDAQLAWQVMASTDLNSWVSLGIVTNTLGEVQFTDAQARAQNARFYRVLARP